MTADLSSLSTQELMAMSADPSATESLTTRLNRLTASVRGERSEVALTVNVDGMITDLRLTAASLALGPHELAQEIARLSARACATVLAESVSLVSPAAGDRLAAELVKLAEASERAAAGHGEPRVAPEPAEPQSPRRPVRDGGNDEDDDEITPQSWALRD